MRGPLTVFVGAPFSRAMRVATDGVEFDSGVRAALELVHSQVIGAGFRLLSSHISDKYGTEFDEAGIVPRDNRWVRECDIYLALLPLGPEGSPYRSDGTFVEIGMALARNKQVVIVIEARSHPDQSYYVRNLDCEPNVTIYDWQKFVQNPAKHLLEVTADFCDDAGPSQESGRREEATDPDQVLELLSHQDAPDVISVRDVPLIVLPGVFSPRYSHAPDYMMSDWRIPAGARVLDLGCGCGIMGVFALLDGAGSLTAIDSSAVAIENTRLNLERQGLLQRSKLLIGDAYNTLGSGEVYDLILLSPPYWNRTASNQLAAACFDEDYRFLSAAIRGASAHLATDGRLLIIFSDQGEVSRLLRLLQDASFYVERCVVHRPSMPGGHVRVFFEAKPLKG